jgi:Ca-activated chloride channel family protein
MIEFARPMWLWGLAGIPVVALLLLVAARRRRGALGAFVGPELQDALAPGFSWRRRLAKGALRLFALAMLILALATPRFGSQLVKVEREGIDLVIALDTSLSMLAEDVAPNRLAAAKREISDLIGGLKGDRVGLVAFSGEAVTLCPLTVDYEAAMMLARSIDVYTVSEPGSAIGDAIQVAATLFEGTEKGDRAVILVTDGENTAGNLDDGIRAATEADIRVYAIGLGSPRGELIPERGTDGAVMGYKKDARGETVLSRLDEGALERIAAATRGKYLPATTEGLELKVLYDEISGMERKLIKGEFVERRKERFWLPLALALAALLLDVATGSRASRRRDGRRRVLHTGAAAAMLAVAVVVAPPAHAKSVNRGKIKAGNQAYMDRDYAKAFSLYREAVGDSTRPPKNSYGAFYNGGNALFHQQKYQPAIDYYQRSYSPDSVLTGRMLYNRGNALLKSGKPGEAVESYVQALQYLPDDEDVRHNLEVAVLQKQQQQQQEKQKGDKGKEQDQQQGQAKADSSQTGEQDPGGRKQEQPSPDPKQPQEAQAQADSSADQPPDSSATPLTPEEMRKLSKEDAMRILQALEDREQQLQKERRKAAFRKLKRSGKDW